MSETLLEARGIRTGYGRLPVVFNVDLEVKEGEIVALLGPNGAGKTTTLRALSGMLPLMAGEVRLDGTSLKGKPANVIARGGIVHVPQGRGIFPNLRVDETLRLACAMAGIRRTEVDARVADMYAIFERLHERRTQLAGTLSGGEQQMLAIARGLIMKPRLLMIDEMSQGLAPTIGQGLIAIVRSLPEQGVSVLIVEQFVTHALAVASRAYVLEKGEVAFNGKAAELARDEAFVKGSYLGEGGIDAADVNGATELRFDDDTADLPLHADGLLQTIEDRAAHEGRNATEVLLDLLREALESPARQGNGNGNGGAP
jgi:branched-chain amino acid transport system ATP-binding protein